jgi:hypothetical protein
MIVLIVAICLGVVAGMIAHSKGRSFFGWWVYGTALAVVAIPHALIIRPNSKVVDARRVASGADKKCPKCAEFVKAEATVCRFCRHEFPSELAVGAPAGLAPMPVVRTDGEIEQPLKRRQL